MPAPLFVIDALSVPAPLEDSEWLPVLLSLGALFLIVPAAESHMYARRL